MNHGSSQRLIPSRFVVYAGAEAGLGASATESALPRCVPASRVVLGFEVHEAVRKHFSIIPGILKSTIATTLGLMSA